MKSERGVCTDLTWSRTLMIVAIFGNTGMFLAGYTSAVQSNAMLPLAEDFNLTTAQKEGVTSSTLLFAAGFTGGTCGTIAQRFKPCLRVRARFCQPCR